MRYRVVIYKAFCLDEAQGHMNGAPKETRTHSPPEAPYCRHRSEFELQSRFYVHFRTNALGKYIPLICGLNCTTLAPWVECSPNGPGDLGSIPGRVIRKTLKMLLDTSLLNTQHYKVRIKGKVKQFRERRGALPYISL